MPYICGLEISAAGSNRRGTSLIPRSTGHQLVNYSEIVKFFLKTNDGRYGRPGCGILSATYASAKTWRRKGSISSHCLYGQLLLTRF